VVPFQPSASRTPLLDPTASQAVDDAQETAVSTFWTSPVLLAVGCIAQEVPFQVSASDLGYRAPTAVHWLDEVHEIPEKLLVVAPLGAGVGWIVHAPPLKLSASGTSLFDCTENPTAVQAPGRKQLTPTR
jgi:hypothetical protein